MTKKTIIFVLKIWILLNIACPMLFQLVPIVQDGFSASDFGVNMLYLVIFGLAFSVPGMVALFFVIRYLSTRRPLLVLIMAVLIFASFFVLDPKFITIPSNLMIPAVYTAVFAVLLYCLKIPKN